MLKGNNLLVKILNIENRRAVAIDDSCQIGSVPNKGVRRSYGQSAVETDGTVREDGQQASSGLHRCNNVQRRKA